MSKELIAINLDHTDTQGDRAANQLAQKVKWLLAQKNPQNPGMKTVYVVVEVLEL